MRAVQPSRRRAVRRGAPTAHAHRREGALRPHIATRHMQQATRHTTRHMQQATYHMQRATRRMQRATRRMQPTAGAAGRREFNMGQGQHPRRVHELGGADLSRTRAQTGSPINRVTGRHYSQSRVRIMIGQRVPMLPTRVRINRFRPFACAPTASRAARDTQQPGMPRACRVQDATCNLQQDTLRHDYNRERNTPTSSAHRATGTVAGAGALAP